MSVGIVGDAIDVTNDLLHARHFCQKVLGLEGIRETTSDSVTIENLRCGAGLLKPVAVRHDLPPDPLLRPLTAEDGLTISIPDVAAAPEACAAAGASILAQPTNVCDGRIAVVTDHEDGVVEFLSARRQTATASTSPPQASKMARND